MATITNAYTGMVTFPFDGTFYAGGSTLSEVPSKWPVALDGHPYLIDTEVTHTFTDFWQHESIPLIRTQADPSNFPKESTLNPEGLWRRFQDSAHHGAGQAYLDRDDLADPYRYHTSKGIDPWTKYKVQLLPDTEQKRSSVNTNLAIVSAGARVYIADGQSLRYSTDITGGSPTFTAVTGTNASSITALTSDGTNVYAGFGTGVAKTDTSTGAATDAWNALVVSNLAWVKGRLMAVGASTNACKVYNITASGAAPAALFTHNNASFTFVGFAEGQGYIYAAGYAGDKSQIYKTAVKTDATALDALIPAGELPDGEIVRCIGGYLGNIVIGTDKGWRFATVDTNGNLNFGLLVETAAAVYCFEPQAQYIWYGNTNYDSTSTGLGRMDITEFTQTLTPAYASDLMVTGQGAVQAVATFQNIRFFAVSGLGFYAEVTTKVASGTLTTGIISFGLPDQKTSLYLDVRNEPLDGSYAGEISVDNGSYTSIGANTTAGDTGTQLSTSQQIGQHFELRFTLTRDATDTTVGPVFERWTFKAFPRLDDGAAAEVIRVPLLIYRNLSAYGVDTLMDVQDEVDHIKELRATRRVCTLQELNTTYSGFVNDYTWIPKGLVRDDSGNWATEGTMVVSFKRVI